jgi:hypothetical protein
MTQTLALPDNISLYGIPQELADLFFQFESPNILVAPKRNTVPLSRERLTSLAIEIDAACDGLPIHSQDRQQMRKLYEIVNMLATPGFLAAKYVGIIIQVDGE